MSRSHAAIAEQPPAARFYNGRRRRFAIISVLVLAAAIGLAVLVRHWPFSRQRVTEALQDDFHGTVTFTRFRNTIFPHPGCVAEGAALVHAGAPADSPPFASAQKLVIRAHYLDFLVRPGYISHIGVEGLEIHILPRGSMPAAPPNQSPSSTRVGEVVAN